MTYQILRVSCLRIFLFFCFLHQGFSQNAEGLFKSSQANFDKSEYDQALLFINRALEIDSSIAGYFLHRATIYYQMELYEKTIKDCYSAMRLKNDNPDVYLLRGKVCQVTESYGGAILFFGKAIKYSSENEILFESFLNRGKAYYELKKYYDAKSDFASAYNIDPNSIELLIAMSDNFLMINDNDNALSSLNRAIEIDPYYAESYAMLGRIAIKNKNFPEAIKSYSKYCELNPEDASAYNKLGEAFFLNKDYDSAMSTLNKSIMLLPNDPMVFKIRGLIFIEKQDIEMGCNNLFRALQFGYLEKYGYDLLEVYLNKCEDQ